MQVGTKLLLLALLPVCALLALTAFSMAEKKREADRLSEFRSATENSFDVASVARALASERISTAIDHLRADAAAPGQLTSARRRVDATRRAAVDRSDGHEGPVDVAGRLDAVGRELGALRRQADAGSLTADETTAGYGVIANRLIELASDLDSGRPARASGQAADAYVALLRAIEAAERERAALASAIGAGNGDAPASASPWAAIEGAELDAFRRAATSRLTAELDALLFTPPGLAVRDLRERLTRDASQVVEATSLQRWLDVSGARIARLRRLEREASVDLAAAASSDLNAARTQVLRELALSLAILIGVTALALALRRSIARPLGEVSLGADMLSRGDLAFDVTYAGRDEIGDVATAFRKLRTMAERLAEEIRAMNVAIGDNRLEHRADVRAFEGAWAHLLDGMNDTMDSFSELHEQRRHAERDAAQIFSLSVDLMGIAGTDGYFKRVNPAFERTLGYSAEELLSRPSVDFVHPDDRSRTRRALSDLSRGDVVIQFENRYLHRDGSVRWLQWNSQPVPEEGLIYGAARDVTDSRRNHEEQAALRHVATLVAQRAAPDVLFRTVAEKVAHLLAARSAQLVRHERDGNVTVLGRAQAASGAQGGAVASLSAPIVVDDCVWGAIEATAAEAEPPPPDAEERLTRFTELVAIAIADAESRAQLAASRARVVRAADEARRRIQRDLHDGAQMRLVHSILALQLARQALVGAGGEALELVDEGLEHVERANAELRELARGMHPSVLTEGGLGRALETLASGSPIPVTLEEDIGSRLPEPVEVTAYFVVSEALTNAAKHSYASSVKVLVDAADDQVRLSISDDGVGGADETRGSGLVGIADRVDAVGGTLTIQSRPGEGTRLTIELPVNAHGPAIPN